MTTEHHDDQAQAEGRDGYRPPSGLPRRGYSWEPFKPGNQVALTHGAYSDRLVGPRALEIAQHLTEDGAFPGYLAEPRYRPAVLAYCTTLARLERVERWLEAQAAEGVPLELAENGEVRGATRLLMDLERQAERHRQALGLTPLAAARLGKDVAAQSVSLAQVWAQMDQEGEA